MKTQNTWNFDEAFEALLNGTHTPEQAPIPDDTLLDRASTLIYNYMDDAETVHNIIAADAENEERRERMTRECGSVEGYEVALLTAIDYYHAALRRFVENN